MCGRYTLTRWEERYAQLLGMADLAGFPFKPRYNIAPTQPVLTIREGGVWAFSKWGLIPSWVKDTTSMARLINARSETAAHKPAFRSAMKQRRCLIPADGYYEWQAMGRTKQPWLITMADHSLFAFASLWETWCDEEGNEQDTCTILTTTPNELCQPIHDRMPVILAPSDYDLWLDMNQSPDRVQQLLRPAPEEWLKAKEVSRHVNNPRHDDRRCIESADQGRLF